MNKVGNNESEIDERIQRTVRKLVTLIVNGDYAGIVSWTRGSRYTEDAIADSIREYGTTPILPPEWFYAERLDAIEIESQSPRSWSVVFPLWTEEEGESDLSVEIQCSDSVDDVLEVELDNIHVL